MAGHGFGSIGTKNKRRTSPRRRIVQTREETRSFIHEGREFIYHYTLELLECGHEGWAGLTTTYTPARHRACTQCRDEAEHHELEPVTIGVGDWPADEPF